ncbi:MAG: PD-(D/E)XK nuclease family transposase [Lachnospiraceae bacterium]|nr:PD-(D/E)XK nuclease family transposase [Lachnospiraceae bacterium]
MELTNEEKREKVRDFRPIDDVFFEVLAQNPKVCEEMLRTLLEDESLEVISVITQSDERNIYGRSVRLDALCILGNGSKVNVEVQRSDNDNHLKRARFNASSITVRDSNPGTRFEEVIELYIVYISEFDFLKGDKTIYHVEKVLRETGEVIDDGLHEIFVNTVIDDGTDIAELMACFMKKEVKSPKFPVLSAEVQRLKETEGGVRVVCEVMQRYEKLAVEEAMQKDHVEKIKKLLQKGCSKEFILDLDYTEDEYTEAVRELR